MSIFFFSSKDISLQTDPTQWNAFDSVSPVPSEAQISLQ